MSDKSPIERKAHEFIIQLKQVAPSFNLEISAYPSGATTIDLRKDETFIVVQISKLGEIGISNLSNQNIFGTGHDHCFQNSKDALEYIHTIFVNPVRAQRIGDSPESSKAGDRTTRNHINER